MVPLCSFDKVQNTVEKLIQNGYIRRVYALRFGYCCYRDVEVGNVLYPVWQIECDYAFAPSKQLSPMKAIRLWNGALQHDDCQCADRRIYESCQTEGQAAGCSQGDFMEGCVVSG